MANVNAAGTTASSAAPPCGTTPATRWPTANGAGPDDHLARDVDAEGERRLRPELVEPLAEQQVGEGDADAVHPDQHVVGPRDRVVDVADLHARRAAGRGHLDRAHGARLLVRTTRSGGSTAQPTVVAIHLAPGARLPLRAVQRVTAEAGKGLVGDRYHGTRHRHVSVQSAEDLAEAAEALGRAVPPEGTRRNLTISHGRVPNSPGSRMTIGGIELEVVRIAAPCRLMDDTLGPGGAAALRRRAGSICRVLVGGEIGVGDPVRWPPVD